MVQEGGPLFYWNSLDGLQGQLDWRDKVLLFQCYRCRDNFEPGRIQYLSNQNT